MATVVDSQWYDKYGQQAWIDQLRKRFDYKFGYLFDDPDDAFSSSIEKLLVTQLPNSTISHQSNTDAYVRQRFDWNVLDVFRSINGRIQAPLKLRLKGRAYVQLFMRHCIGRFAPSEISQFTQLPLDIVNCCVQWLERERKCPSGKERLSLSDQSGQGAVAAQLVAEQAQGSMVERELEQAETQALIRMLIREESSTVDFGSSWPLMDGRVPSLNLSAFEYTILRMHYWEDTPLAEIARAFGEESHTIRNARNRVLDRVRDLFKEHRIDVR